LAAAIDRSDREGLLPRGCEVVASLDLSSAVGALALGRLRETLPRNGQDGLLGAMSFFGLDAFRDLKKVVLCKIAARGLVEEEVGFALAGLFPRDLMARIATAKNTLRSDMVEGIPALAQERFWLAQRGGGELVFCTSSRMLASFLTGPVEDYQLNHGAALTVAVSGFSLQAAMSRDRGLRAAELDAVTRLTVDLAADGSTLTATAVTRDGPAAEKLAATVKDLVKDWREHLAGSGRAAPEISVHVAGSNTIIRAKLPPKALDSVLGTLMSNAAILRPR